MARNIFSVSASLDLDLRTFKSKMNGVVQGAGRAARTVEMQFSRTAKVLEGWGAKMTLLGGGMFAGMLAGFKVLMDRGGDLADMSDELGMSTNALSELGYAASMAGINMEKLTGGLTKMEKFLAGGKAKDVLKKMGLDAASIQKASPDEAFTRIVDALGKVGDQNTKMDLAQSVFGKSGGAFLRMAKDGAAGVIALREEAKVLGLSLDKDGAEKLRAMGDSFDAAIARANGLAMALKLQLTPAINWMITQGSAAVKWVQRFTAEHPPLVNWIVKMTAASGAVASVLGVAAVAAASVIRALATLAGVAKTIVGWIGAKTAATVADTAATTANTAAQAANTAARVTNAAAGVGGAAAAGAGAAGAGAAAAGAGAGAAGLGILGSLAAVAATGAVAYGGTRYILSHTGGDQAIQKGMLGYMDRGQDSENRFLGERSRQIMAARGMQGAGGSVDQENKALMQEQNRKLDQQNEYLRKIAASVGNGPGPSLMPVFSR